MIVVNSIVPIFLVIILGLVLQRAGFLKTDFLYSSDLLLFYIMLPVLLFREIAKQSPDKAINWDMIIAALAVITVGCCASLLYAKLVGMQNSHVGSFSQACYRFNTYIGLAVTLAVCGEEGVREFGLLVGFLIPPINLAVIGTLIWYSGKTTFNWNQLRFFLKSILANPVILACCAGLLFSRLQLPLPKAIDNTLAIVATPALPLALISVGASLTFSGLKEHLFDSLIAAACKLILVPIAGLLFFKWMNISGTAFTVAMIYFALPTSPITYVLSAQMNSDVDLAKASIVISTLLSAFSLSLVLWLFH